MPTTLWLSLLADGYNKHDDVPIRYKAKHFQDVADFVRKFATTIRSKDDLPYSLSKAARDEVHLFLMSGSTTPRYTKLLNELEEQRNKRR